MLKSRYQMTLLSGVAAATLLVGTPAFAQSGAADAQAANATKSDESAASSSNDIIVTANKRSERIQDVAQAVSAVSAEELVRTQTLDLESLATRVPGLSLQGAGGLTRITLRGLNSGGEGATVATVIDDIPLSFSGSNASGAVSANDIDSYDLQQIEVLRGPQGTLYGATAEGGLIKYVTKKPDPTRLTAGAEVGVLGLAHADTAGYSGKAYLNLPLSSTLAIRGSGFYEFLPGYIGNKLLRDTHVNETKKYGGRVELMWSPTDRFTARATVLLQNRDDSGRNYIDAYGVTKPSDQFGLPDGYDLSTYINGSLTTRSRLYGLHLDYDFGPVRLQSITSYGEINYNFVQDVTAFAGAFGPGSRVTDFEVRGLKKFSEEVRLASNPGSTLFGLGFDWQIGGFYTLERTAFQQTYTAYAGNTALLDLAHDDIPSRFLDRAGYVDATLHLTDRFDIQAGVRYASNRTSSTFNLSGPLFPALVVGKLVAGGEDVATYSVAPRYHFSKDVMIYGRVASGYRPGGAQTPVGTPPPGVPNTYGSDSTTNYELGLKGSFLNKMLTVDVALFRIDWNNIQIVYIYTDPGSGQNFTLTGNVGSARSQGAEWNIGLTPMPGLTLGLLGSYTDAKLTKAAPAIGGNVNDQLAYVPDVSLTGSVDYDFRLGDKAKGFIGGDVAYIGGRYSDFPQHVKLPSYTTIDAHIGAKLGNFSLQLYGQNLADTRGISSYTNSGAYNNYGFISFIRPRVIGLRLAVDLR